MSKEEFFHEYKGCSDIKFDEDGFPVSPIGSKCFIRILDDNDKPLTIIRSQIKNTRTSFTNRAELIAQNIYLKIQEHDFTTAIA